MMAQSKDKEFQNFSKTGRLLRDIGATTVKKKLKSCLTSFDFQDILAKNSHNLYHLWNDQKCCRCVNDDLSGHAPVLDDVQLNSLFTSHPPVCRNVCSCSYTPVSGITIDSLDLTLTMRIIENVASLNPDEKAYLRGIDKTRCFLDNACSTFRLSDADFDHHWSALTLNITQLAGTCGPGEQKNVEMEIETLKSADNPFKDNAEAENYYRCDTLITDVGSAVLRDKFMDQFPNQTFEDILNNNIHVIYNLRKGMINCSCGQRARRLRNKPLFDSQWNLLFTQQPSTSYSSTDCRSYSAIQCVNVDSTDVTLISCLLLNIANLNTNERDLVEKIREAKNNLKSHNTEAKLSDTDFKQQWNNVSQNIENLAKTCGSKLLSCPQYVDNMHREIETLKTRVLDISFVKAISKLSKEFRPQLDILGEKTSDILDKIQSLETNLGKHRDQLTREIEISESIIKRTVEKTKFVRTRAFKFAVEQIKQNKQFVMFIGLPGDGKTAHAIHLMQEVKNGGNFHKTSKHPFIIADPSDVEMLNLISLNGNLVVLIDDMFGRYNASPQTIRKWQKYYGKLEVWFADPLNSSCNYLIATMRKDIFNSCETSLKTLEIYKTGIIIDMTSSDLCLDFVEKKSIVRAIISEALISDSQIQNVCKENKHLGFPQCCRMFSNNTKFHNSVESFFQNPVAYLQSDLKMMFDGWEEERLRFCGLALIVFHGGCLHERYCYEQNCSEQDVERLQNSTLICGIRYSKEIGNTLIDNLKSFASVYVECNEQKSEYTFSHSSYEQAIVNLMFERNTELMIRSCAFSHLVRPGTFSPKEFHYKMIVERISKELNIHRHAVFCNLADMDMWGDDSFKRKVTNTFNSEDFGLHYHMQDGRNDNMSLLVCGARAGNHYLVEFLMEFSPSSNQLHRALDIAGRNGREQVFDFLLENGAEANVKTFCQIIKSGNIKLFKDMMERNIAKCSIALLKTRSVFKDICVAGKKVMAEIFLSYFRNFLESENVDILLCFAGFSESHKFVEYLHGETLKTRSFGKTRQHLPCVSAHLDITKYMLEELSFPLHIVFNGLTNLHYACQGGSVATVKYLIERGLSVTELTTNKESVLHIACQFCHFDLVQYLVEEYQGLLQMVNNDGFTNLHAASLGGSVDVVKYLIEKGEKRTQVTINRESVLHIACQYCHFDLVQYFVEEYPSLLQMVDKDGFTNLHAASLGGSVDVVKYLLAKGEKVTEVTLAGQSVLHIACSKSHFDLVQFLVEEFPTLLQMEDKNGFTNLHMASVGGSVDVVKYLLAKGEKVTEVSLAGQSVLHIACSKSHFDLVQFLVEEFPTLLQMEDKNGFTNLHMASVGGSVDVVKYLIAKGEKVTNVTKDRKSVLHIACQSGHFELVQCFVEEYPSLLQMVDKDGFTNLHAASVGGSVDVVKYLIEKGEKVTNVTKDRNSVLHIACRKCHFELVHYLVEENPSLLQMVDKDRFTNLHAASVGGCVDVVKYLIAKGEEVKEVNTNKDSVLHIACQFCHFDLVQYLVEEYPGLLQMVDNDGFTNLHAASLGGSVDVVKYLIEKGEKRTQVAINRESVLHIACQYCHFDLVQYFVEEYPSLLQMVDKDGFTNLHAASLGGSVDVVKYLIAKGEKVTNVTKDRKSVLYIACESGHFELVQYFVAEYPGFLQMVNNDRFTNLHAASVGGSVDVVKYLIERGEKRTQVTINRESVLHIACQYCHFDLVQYFVEEYPSLLQMVDKIGFTNLHAASLGGSVDVVKYLIEKGEKVTNVTKDRNSVLHIACRKCHFDLVQYLVEEYPSLLQMVDKDRFTNLHAAAVGGSVDMVKCLIAKGEKVTNVTKDRKSVLHIACESGHFELVQYFVAEYPGFLQMVNNDRFTNLHAASVGGSVDVVKYLIERGEKRTQVTINRESVLHIACQYCHFDLVQYFVEEYPSLLQMVDKIGFTNLHAASLGGSVDVVKYLIEKGEKVTNVTKDRNSVLHIACRKCHFDLVQYLVEEYPSLLQMVDKDRFTNLHAAAVGGSVDMVKCLIAKGEKVTNVTKDRKSVLHIACQSGHFELVQYFVEEYPSLLQMVDKDGFTNLHAASIGGSVDMVKYLIEKGEKVTNVTKDRKSVLHIACQSGHFELVQYFVEKYPSLLQMVDKDGFTNLHAASVGGCVDVVKYLIEKGEKVTNVTKDRNSVLHIACRKCHFELVHYLVEENPSLLQMVDKDRFTNLHAASVGGCVDVVKYLIAKGEEVIEVTTNKDSVLHIACQFCHFDLVQYLVEEFPSLLQMVNKDGFTNLHASSRGGSVYVVKFLIAKGEEVTEVTTNKDSALHIACQSGHFELVQYFVEEFPSLLQMEDKDGFTNLHAAAAGGSVDVVKYLIAKGEQTAQVTIKRESVLHIACQLRHFDLVRYFVEIYPSLLQMVNKDGYTNLHKASNGGCVDVVKYLIAKGEKVTNVTKDRKSVLHIACQSGHFELVQYLVEEYPSLLQMVDKDGFTNLHAASVGGSVDMVKYLIAKGEKLSELETNRESLLKIACRKSHLKLVQYFVEEYPSLLQIANNEGFTNLHAAAVGGSVDVVKYLIAKGEKVTNVTKDKKSVLHIACESGHFELVQYFVEEYPSLLQMANNEGFANLHGAAEGGSLDVVKYLIAKGEKVTNVTKDRKSVLHIACQLCHYALVQYFVEECPSLLQMVNNDGFTNLHAASGGGCVDMVKYLIAKGEKVTNVTKDRKSVLHIACQFCHFDLVQYFVEEFPSLLQMVDKLGCSNLHAASQGGSVDVVKYLIAKGEKITNVTKDRQSVLHIACQLGHFDLVQYFVEEYPSLLQLVDNYGFTNLHAASKGGSVDVVKYLITKGQNVTDVTTNGETVLHIAYMNHHRDLIRYFVEGYPRLFLVPFCRFLRGTC